MNFPRHLALTLAIAITPSIFAQTVAETIENACQMLILVDHHFMAVELKKDCLVRCMEMAIFYRENATLSDAEKISQTAQIPAGNRFYHLAHGGIAYTAEECNQITQRIGIALILKARQWGIAFESPEDILTARAEGDGYLANM